MANVLYPKFKESLLDKLHDLNTDNIVASRRTDTGSEDVLATGTMKYVLVP